MSRRKGRYQRRVAKRVEQRIRRSIEVGDLQDVFGYDAMYRVGKHWSKIAKAIGKALNGDVMTKLNEVQERLDGHIRIDDERNADMHRVQILRFNRELLQDNISYFHRRLDFHIDTSFLLPPWREGGLAR